jgi:putative FmdB family regulatory protein
MPYYDYFCPACQKRVSIFQSYADYGVKPVACPECKSKKLKRQINRVRVMKSEDRRLDDLSDPSWLGEVDENDPKAIGRAMRRMGREVGEDLPPEFDEITRRLESGESPDAIEKDMPELAGGGDGMGGMGMGGDDE